MKREYTEIDRLKKKLYYLNWKKNNPEKYKKMCDNNKERSRKKAELKKQNAETSKRDCSAKPCIVNGVAYKSHYAMLAATKKGWLEKHKEYNRRYNEKVRAKKQAENTAKVKQIDAWKEVVKPATLVNEEHIAKEFLNSGNKTLAEAVDIIPEALKVAIEQELEKDWKEIHGNNKAFAEGYEQGQKDTEEVKIKLDIKTYIILALEFIRDLASMALDDLKK